MSFCGLILTNQGRNKMAAAINSENTIKFTHVQLGDGAYNGSYNSKTALSNKVMEIPVTRVLRRENEVIIDCDWDSKSAKTGFYLREIGLIGNGVLFYYDNCGVGDAEYIEPQSEVVTKQKRFRFKIYVGDEVNITTYTASGLYASAEEMKEALEGKFDKTGGCISGEVLIGNEHLKIGTENDYMQFEIDGNNLLLGHSAGSNHNVFGVEASKFQTGFARMTKDDVIVDNYAMSDEGEVSVTGEISLKKLAATAHQSRGTFTGNIDNLYNTNNNGTYWIASANASGTHPPNNGYYDLIVESCMDNVAVQIALTYNGNDVPPTMYIRSRSNSVWQPWGRIMGNNLYRGWLTNGVSIKNLDSGAYGTKTDSIPSEGLPTGFSVYGTLTVITKSNYTSIYYTSVLGEFAAWASNTNVWKRYGVVDTALDTTSANPVQNRVITTQINKLKTNLNRYVSRLAGSSVTYSGSAATPYCCMSKGKQITGLDTTHTYTLVLYVNHLNSATSGVNLAVRFQSTEATAGATMASSASVFCETGEGMAIGDFKPAAESIYAIPVASYKNPSAQTVKVSGNITVLLIY